MDILLCALDTAEKDIYKIKGQHDTIDSDCNSIAYADDMQSITASKEALQKKANIVSAFSITFRIKINLSKLRTLLVQHGLEAEQEDNPTIAVHTEGWIPNIVSLRKDSNFKALGIKHSEHNDGQEHFQELRAMLQRTCMIIAKKRASPAAKLMALNSSVIPAAIYKGLYAPWPLK